MAEDMGEDAMRLAAPLARQYAEEKWEDQAREAIAGAILAERDRCWNVVAGHLGADGTMIDVVMQSMLEGIRTPAPTPPE